MKVLPLYFLLFLMSIAACTSIPSSEKINPEEVTAYTLQMDTLMKLRDPFAPEIYLLNDTLLVMTYFGNYPLKEERYMYTELVEYFHGYMDMKGGEVVYVAQNFGYISSYRYRNGKLRKNWEKQVSDFLFEQKNMKLIFQNDHRYGFDGIQTKKNRSMQPTHLT